MEEGTSFLGGITAGEKGSDSQAKSRRPEFAEEGFDYPSMAGQGWEPVVIPREARYSDNDGVDRLKVREIPMLLRDKVLEAAEWGRLKPVLTHYEKFIDDNTELFAPHVSRNLKTLFSEGKETQVGESRDAWVKKVKNYLDGMVPAKNADYKR